MSLVAIDGFDMYNGVGAPSLTVPSIRLKWTFLSTGGITLITGLRGTGQGLRINGTGAITRAFLAARTSFAVGFALRWNTMPSDNTLMPHVFFMTAGGTYQWGFKVNTLGGIEVYRFSSNSAGTLLHQTLPGIVQAGTINYVEIESTISTTTGSIKIYLNGDTTPLINLTNINNANAGAGTSVGAFGVGANNGNFTGQFDIDDWYEGDTNTRVGEGFVETLRPSGDGTITWTPDTGANNYSRMNETLVNGDTSYCQTGTLNNQDLQDLSDLATVPTTIFGVQLVNFARKTDAATRGIGLVVKSGGTTNVGASNVLTTTYGRFEKMHTVDPNTAAAWTAANVNAMQAGTKVLV